MDNWIFPQIWGCTLERMGLTETCLKMSIITHLPVSLHPLAALLWGAQVVVDALNNTIRKKSKTGMTAIVQENEPKRTRG